MLTDIFICAVFYLGQRGSTGKLWQAVNSQSDPKYFQTA